ncbi:hypothetical protein EDC65_1559 [Stella humosa]|uniref:Inner membrane protein n=1 Tax=Stella humosa TaxID=94 RepID=A0A3N1M220_9PROT|nr:hypothetical protein [Stella humosa]ROP99771.1 hypothetical protein EDC65_1559 [Stella humosa]BBK31002.1 hypothetical protein STHU_16360 [Stella humosa]
MRLPAFLGTALLVGGLVVVAFVAGQQTSTATRLAAVSAVASDGGSALVARIDAVEARLARMEAGRSNERLIAGLLNLQGATASSRPWPRELQVVRDLAGPGQLPPTLADVLSGHAARGVPTRGQLRERFAAIQPELLAQAPAEGGIGQRLLHGSRAAVAGAGLATPPPPSRTEAAVAGIALHLARDDLSAALIDAASLDPSLQARIADWSVQARGRLAVDQAIRELLLHAFAAGSRRP